MDWQRSMWFAGNLNDEEVAEMVQNMQLAASEMDSVLVQLLSTWAERGRDGSPRSQVCPTLLLSLECMQPSHLMHKHVTVMSTAPM